jgi:2-dehydropantoate 2-reductase
LVHKDTFVLTLQNGYGNSDLIAEVVPKSRILIGTTSHGATVLGTGQVQHGGVGETIIGALTDENRSIILDVQKMFQQAGIETTLSENPLGLVWGKVLINVGINALTALYEVKNGQLLDSPAARLLLKDAVSEGERVVRAMGICLPYADPVEHTLKVAYRTAENISSMLQDIKNGRNTEIAFINGAIVKEGKQRNIPVPINEMLVRLIQGKEELCTEKR